MIEVFKTNVHQEKQAKALVALMRRHFPKRRINFDLDDCDKILRIEGPEFVPEKVRTFIVNMGFDCDVLE